MWRSPFTVCVHVLPYGPRLHYPFVEPNPPGQNQTDELVWTTSDSPVTKTIVFFIFVFNVAFEDSADPWCHVWCVMFLSCSPLQSCLCSTFCIPNTWFPNLTFSLTFDPSPVGHRVGHIYSQFKTSNSHSFQPVWFWEHSVTAYYIYYILYINYKYIYNTKLNCNRCNRWIIAEVSRLYNR